MSDSVIKCRVLKYRRRNVKIPDQRRAVTEAKITEGGQDVFDMSVADSPKEKHPFCATMSCRGREIRLFITLTTSKEQPIFVSDILSLVRFINVICLPHSGTNLSLG